MSELLDRINEICKTCRPTASYSLEPGRGETYRLAKPVLYAHSVYERSSVLAGQPRRLFVEQWETWEQARTALSDLRKKDRTFKYDDYGEGGGTTYIPSSVLTRHLPDDEG